MPKEKQSTKHSAQSRGAYYTETIVERHIQTQNTSPDTQSNAETAVVKASENSIKTTFTQHKYSAQNGFAFTIVGGIDQVNEAKLKAIVALLQKMTGDISINVVTLILGGSPEGLEKLKDLYESGELTEVLDIPVKQVQFIEPEIMNNDQETAKIEKSHLIQEIITQRISKRDLRDADLSYANLNRANLSGVNLIGANLSETDLSHVDLSGAILNHANLNHANLNHTNLSRTNLSHTNLNRANFRDALINPTTVISEKWRLVWELVNFGGQGYNLIGADMSDANLSDANLSRANLICANLIGADLSRANLSHVNFREALINQTTLISEKWRLVWELVNSGGKGRNLSRADLSEANLSLADLSEANLSLADLSGADLSGADLSHTDLNRTYLSGADLTNADLTNADLTNAYLIRTDFSSANFSGAIVQNARFTNSIGIPAANKADLKQQGAIFEDPPGDALQTNI